ncbi:MAG: periplasmic divalent cation tolerance protein [Chloroflexota bacterium]|jgi:periplasmic divalent cation tolerance protein|nr:periplasmic divalent cation tolerance protein [Chloroflexota bacterium]
MAEGAVVVFTTVGRGGDANRISNLLVEERLAGCVSVLGGMRSTYRWEGRVVEEGEVLLLIKTTAARLPELRERLLAEHPYEVPEVLVLEAREVPEPYARWLEESVTPSS